MRLTVFAVVLPCLVAAAEDVAKPPPVYDYHQPFHRIPPPYSGYGRKPKRAWTRVDKWVGLLAFTIGSSVNAWLS